MLKSVFLLPCKPTGVKEVRRVGAILDPHLPFPQGMGWNKSPTQKHTWAYDLGGMDSLLTPLIRPLELNSSLPFSQIWPIHLKHKVCVCFWTWSLERKVIPAFSEVTGQIRIIIFEYSVIQVDLKRQAPCGGFWDVCMVAWLSDCAYPR